MPRSAKEHIWINKEGFVFHLEPDRYMTVYFENDRISYRINDDNAVTDGYEDTLQNKGKRYDLPHTIEGYAGQEYIKIALFSMEDETISAHFDTWVPGEDS